MANKKREVDLMEAPAAPDPADENVDSQLVITLFRGGTVPALQTTKTGRMTGQMVMGVEGAGIMRIDNELRRAQVELRRRTLGGVPPENTRSLEERVMMTKENSSG